ncbi:MAG: GIY-YIG nuclease family protein [Candidatus Tantalella remota]|nr:GIY-YIG nuclease family protein [Candidatus Tantalella remota]
MKEFYVYILSNKKHGVLYTGVTSNLRKRIYLHKHGLSPGFTKKYRLRKLVYFEKCDTALSAIYREKCIKKWYRLWKIELIEAFNPEWKDLFYIII